MTRSRYGGESAFYRLHNPLATRPYRLEDVYPEGLTGNDAWRLLRGELMPLEPVVMRAFMGGQPADILWSGLVNIICVSTRFVDLLVDNGITGWQMYLVAVHDRQGEPLAGYHGLAITGPECRRDRSRSTIIEKPPIVPGARPRRVYRGLYFYESEWDGSDMFWVSSFGGTVVTAKVRDVLKRSKISNLRLTAQEDAEIDVLLDEFDKDI